MKILISLLLLFFLISCISKKGGNFSEVECSSEQMPEFDGRLVTLLDDNGAPLKDTIIDRIEKRRDVFKPCRDYIYRANFYDGKRNLITSTRIKMTPTGRRWDYAPENQDEVVLQYEYSSLDAEKAPGFVINKNLPVYDWMDETKTGIIENTERIWMHPFRDNQFSFTEVAPFPEINKPLKVGNSWTRELQIHDGWGDWSNTTGKSIYKVIAKESIDTDYGKIENCWKVESESSYPFGKSDFLYWYNEDLGFVRMNYRNYGGQYLEIDLVEVVDR